MLEDSFADAEIIQNVVRKSYPDCLFKLVMTEEGYLQALESYEPDIILSDNTLPQFNATEALRIFNSLSLSIPFILVTGTVSEEFAVNIIKSGADDYILKDRLTRLPAAIEAALQKRKAEADMKRSEETRKLIINATLDAVVCMDTQGNITVWNPQAEKLFGWKESEIKGKKLVDYIVPEKYRSVHVAGLVNYLKTGQGSILNKLVEVSGLNRDGHEFPVEMAIIPIKQAGNDFFCAFIRDITERKKAQEMIKFKANLLNTVGQAVIATDINGFVIYWNKAAEKIYGYTDEEAIGNNIVDLTPARQSKEQAIEIMKALSKGDLWSGEFLVRRKDGTEFPAFVTDSPIHDEHGNLSGIIGISADITAQKNAEAALINMEKQILNQKVQEQKRVSRAIIKAQEEEKNHIGQELHDNINQILAGTKMYLSLAAKRNESVREILKYPMELIQSSIEEIRLLSKKEVTPLKNINLKELVQELVHNLNPYPVPDMEFNYAVSNELISDDLKINIYRIIQEQVNNIMKHADAKKVSIIISFKNGEIIIEVKDNGKGFNLNAKRKGIGISNMINRIESYDGKMEIKSSPGNGCAIIIRIPC